MTGFLNISVKIPLGALTLVFLNLPSNISEL